MSERRATYRAGSALEETLAFQLRAAGIAFEREYKFHPSRRWRFDFAIPAASLAIEVEGGVWSGGRHTRGSGYAADCEKYNEAAILQWRVLRFTGEMIESGAALATIRRALLAD